jgi:hypothetical protein
VAAEELKGRVIAGVTRWPFVPNPKGEHGLRGTLT